MPLTKRVGHPSFWREGKGPWGGVAGVVGSGISWQFSYQETVDSKVYTPASTRLVLRAGLQELGAFFVGDTEMSPSLSHSFSPNAQDLARGSWLACRLHEETAVRTQHLRKGKTMPLRFCFLGTQLLLSYRLWWTLTHNGLLFLLVLQTSNKYFKLSSL